MLRKMVHIQRKDNGKVVLNVPTMDKAIEVYNQLSNKEVYEIVDKDGEIVEVE